MDEAPDSAAPPEQHGDASAAPGAERPPLDLDRLVAVEAELADVEHALGRLDAGTYGTCEICAAPVDEQRLVTAPATRTCADHD